MFSGRRMMMKKLLVLSIVLALTSLANAGYVDITGPDQLVVGGDVGVYDVIAVDDGVEATQGLYVYFKGPAGAASLDISGVTNEVVSGEVYDATIEELQSFGIDTTDVQTPLIWADAVIPSFPATVWTGDMLKGFAFTGLTAGTTIEIVVYGDMDGAVLASKTVEVIPEPMTIALLGLGGLFLRRRK
jgi:hypothetical protein